MNDYAIMDEMEVYPTGQLPEQRLFEEIINKAVIDARSVPIEVTERKLKTAHEKIRAEQKQVDEQQKKAGTFKERKNRKGSPRVYGKSEETILARDAIDFLMNPERSDVYLGLLDVDPENFRRNLEQVNAGEALTESERKARRIFRANLDLYRKEYKWWWSWNHGVAGVEYGGE